MFKNISIFRIAPEWVQSVDQIVESLLKATFVECGPTQASSTGFVPPREENGSLVEAIDGELILAIRTDTRKVPTDALTRRVDELADLIEQQTGRKPGKKQRKELKEQALLELLPVAFIKSAITKIWVSRTARLLIIDTTSQARSDELTFLLVKFLEGFGISHILTEMAPVVAMTHWLGTGEAPYQFSIDRECELKSSDEMKSVVRYSRHPLDTDEVKQHILTGKVPTRVAMTWRDRISFLLTDSLQLRKVAFLDVVFESSKATNTADAFDADVAISTGELSNLIPDLVEALGGFLAGQE